MIMRHHGRELGQSRVRRHRSSIAEGGGGGVGVPPILDITPDETTLLYTAGLWDKPTTNVTVIFTLEGISLGGGPSGPTFPMQDAWRGRPLRVQETATFAGGGTGVMNSDPIVVPLLPCTADFNARDPVSLPLGNANFKLLAYARQDQGSGFRNGFFVEVTDVTDFPAIMVQGLQQSQFGSANGRYFVPVMNDFELSMSMRSNTNVQPPASFCVFMPLDMADGEYRPAVAPTLDQQVETILAGTTGFVLDPQDLSTMFQDAAGTIPVTAVGQPVGRINGKWGTAVEIWSQPTAAARPVLGTDILQYDGVDDFLQNSPNNIFRNVPAMFVCMNAMMNVSGSTERAFFHISNTTSGGFRFTPRSRASGELNFNSARVATATLAATAAGSLVDGVDRVISMLADYTTGGRCRAWLDGVLSADVASVDAGALTDNTDSLIGRIMRMNTASFPGSGNIGRMVFCPFKPSDPQRAIFEQWVAA